MGWHQLDVTRHGDRPVWLCVFDSSPGQRCVRRRRFHSGRRCRRELRRQMGRQQLDGFGVGSQLRCACVGSSWAAPAPGMHIYPHALALTGSNLYVGGETTIAGSPAATSIARWDGSAWSTLGSGVGSPTGYYPTVYALTAFGTNLYVGG